MTWQQAFLRQAHNDFQMMNRLANAEACHQLHYLQMATEKLARAWTINPRTTNPPPRTHIGLVRMLQTLKTGGPRWVKQRLGFTNEQAFRAYITSLENTADRVQSLAPSKAGYSRPNPEYPWRDAATGTIHTPSDYVFGDFNPLDSKLLKLVKLVRDLLRIAE